MPTVTASSVLMATAPNPTVTEIRAPQMIRLSMSRPLASVPNGWASDGPWSRTLASPTSYGYGASTGAAAATTSISSTSAPPIAPSGLRATKLRSQPSPAGAGRAATGSRDVRADSVEYGAHWYRTRGSSQP